MSYRWIGRTLVAAGLVGAVASQAAGQPSTRAYVANRGAPTVTVINLVAAGVEQTIPLEAPPHDVVLADRRVFVSLPTANRLAIIDPVSLTVTGSVAVPGAPRDLEETPDGQRIFISTDDGLRVYDATANTLSAAIAVGAGPLRAIEAGHAGFAGSDGQAFVAACDGGAALRVVTASSGAVSPPIVTGAGPCAVLVGGNALYVANSTDDTVTVFGPELTNPTTVPVADMPIGFTTSSGGVWVASASGTLSLLGGSTYEVVNTFPIGGTLTAISSTLLPGMQIQTLLITDAAGSLRMYRAATGDFLGAVATGALPGAIAVGDGFGIDPVSLSTHGVWSGSQAVDMTMSGDGRFAAFSSHTVTLVEGDTNGLPDIYVRDRLLRRTVRVSVSSSGAEATGGGVVNTRSGSYAPLLSRTGRFVLFQSLATNLVAGDTNGGEDLFLHDRDVDADGLFDEPGQVSTRRVSVRSDGSEGTCLVPAPAACSGPHMTTAMSADGRQIAFSTTRELAPGDGNGLSDVYIHDVPSGRTTWLTLRPGGAPGAGGADWPVLNGSGRFVAFKTSDAGMVGYDTNGVDDVFAVDRDPDGNGAFDEQAPSFTHISLKPGGALYLQSAFAMAISDDGRWVAYNSYPTLAIFDRATGHNAFVRDNLVPVLGSGQFSGDGRHFAYVAFGPSFDFVRIDRDTDADGIFDEAGGVSVGDPVAFPQQYRGPATDATLRLIFVDAPARPGEFAVRDLMGPAAPPYDTDADGLGNVFEAQFGLNPVSSSGADGPSGDPDADGRSNLEEQLAGTHPRGFQTRYLAEGATGSFFSTRIAVANPGTATSNVLLRYLSDTGQTTSSLLVVPPMARRFVHVGNVPSLESAAFSTVIEADESIVADRTMLWTSGFYGSHAETSVASPSTTWFLAEGATHGAFDLFYLLQNPSATEAATVEIRFLRPSGVPIVRTYTVPPARRLTVYVDAVPGLDAADVSAAFTSLNAVPIIVERAMYYSRPEQPFAAGHASAGVTAPATEWFLAEGATGTFFDLFVLLANPSTTAADVRITYLRPNGAPIVRTRTLAPNSRTTIYVEQEDPALLDTAVSTVVESLNAVGIVAERAMWWPATGGWQEAHNSPGATLAAARWGFGDGEVGNPPFNTQTFFLIANTSAQPATVRVTLLLDGASAVSKTFTVPANSRFNVPVGSEFPAAVGKGFGALIESIDATLVPIVVERAMYSDAGGVVWAAGSDALGTPIP